MSTKTFGSHGNANSSSTPSLRPHRRWALGLGFLLLSLVLVAGSAAAAPAGDFAGGIDLGEELAPSLAEKSGERCNAGGYHCSGKWADLIDHLFTNSDGSVDITPSDTLLAELTTKAYCTLEAGVFIQIVPQNGNERVMLDQLYISYAMDSSFAIRLWPDAATGECTLAYIRALYP